MIGDTIYCFDINRREYVRNENGRANGGPIFAKHFEPYKIIGETKQSWLVEGYRGARKINKATMREAGKNGHGGHRWYTQASMDDEIWMHDNKPALIRQLEHGATAAQLRQVAAFLSSLAP